jgi:hypothetical protein
LYVDGLLGRHVRWGLLLLGHVSGLLRWHVRRWLLLLWNVRWWLLLLRHVRWWLLLLGHVSWWLLLLGHVCRSSTAHASTRWHVIAWVVGCWDRDILRRGIYNIDRWLNTLHVTVSYEKRLRVL